MLEYKTRADTPAQVTTDLLLIFPSPYMITNLQISDTTTSATDLNLYIQSAYESHTPEFCFGKTTP
jgi:hypothetical protein